MVGTPYTPVLCLGFRVTCSGLALGIAPAQGHCWGSCFLSGEDTSYEFGLGLRAIWTPKVCQIMAFMAIMRGLGLLFYILLGFRASG